MRVETDNDFQQNMGIYDKLQDRIIFLGQNAILNMNLLFYYTTERMHEKKRNYYYKEYEYFSMKVTEPVRKMVREFDAFLSIENLKADNNGYKEFIVLRAKELQLMKLFWIPKMKEIIEKFDVIFQKRESKVYVSTEVKPFQLEFYNKILIFIPGVRKIFDSEDMMPCVEMYLNGDKNNMVPLSFDKLYELMYIVETFQIHQYAATMLSFMGRPAPGTNLTRITDSNKTSKPGFFSINPNQIK